MGAGQRLRLERAHVQGGGGGWAPYGHAPYLQMWARANGCEWSVGTCGAAAQGEHLTVLQWARANGCCWVRATCLKWAPAGSETREWIQAQPA